MSDFLAFMTPQQIVTALGEEIGALTPQRCEVSCDPAAAFQLAGLLILALRHPHLSPQMRATGDALLDRVIAYFAQCPTVVEVLRRQRRGSPIGAPQGGLC